MTERDLANNFFVTEGELGKNRAEVVAAWLHEINPDVKHVDPLVKVRFGVRSIAFCDFLVSLDFWYRA